MTEAIEKLQGDLYDYPKYYDLVFGSDWKPEFDFLRACIEKYVKFDVKRILEPACGTGRLMFRLADAGFEVAGNDLNEKAIEFCNDRLVRRGHPPSAVVGDMSDFSIKEFAIKKKFDVAFNMINSFKHLDSEKAALGHLNCVADALKKGGIYLLGLHLDGAYEDYDEDEEIDEFERWSARRGNLQVNTEMWVIDHDEKLRRELVGFAYDIFTPTKRMRIESQTTFRCYTSRQMNSLIRKVGKFEVAGTYDFYYDINDPIKIDSRTEDVVYVLRKL